jgi:hypothetical protein
MDCASHRYFPLTDIITNIKDCCPFVTGFMSLFGQALISTNPLFVLHTGDPHTGRAAIVLESLLLDGALRPSPKWLGSNRKLTETQIADQCCRGLTGN